MIRLSKEISLKIVVVVIIVLFILYIPKIFLRNNIYYISIDINRLYQEYVSLKEEHRFLAQQLEDIKFKNQISDTLIMQHFKDNHDVNITNKSQ